MIERLSSGQSSGQIADADRLQRISVLMSHPTGNQYVRNALRSLVERDMLAEFWTTITWDCESSLNRLLPSRLQRQFDRRCYENVPKAKLKSFPWRELVRLLARFSPVEKMLCSGERPFSVIGMFRSFDKKVAGRLDKVHPDAVYAHEGGALQTFQAARKLGIKAVYELPSGYWYWERDLSKLEESQNPDFANMLPKLGDSEAHMRWKDEELALADRVVVPSQHVRRTLSGVIPDERIRVVAYGAPAICPRLEEEKPRSGRPLQILFAGALHQRKGIGYLIKAAEMLGRDGDLTLIGRRFASNRIIDAACRRARWYDSLPHKDLLDMMTRMDVLVLPSLSEGFGMVVTEALACGLPVIVTTNVGAGDLIQDGREGFIVPIASADAIADKLAILHKDRDLLRQMSHNAYETAANNSWEGYRANWAKAVRGLFE